VAGATLLIQINASMSPLELTGGGIDRDIRIKRNSIEHGLASSMLSQDRHPG
jgi:hypothetical protein